MKYMFIRYAVFAAAAVAIIISKDLPSWLWGIIVGAVLVAHALLWQIITSYQNQAKDELEYQVWVKEMDARNDRWNDAV